jgi:CrcB protein
VNLLSLLLGGSCGAMARYSLGAFLLRKERRGFPLGTLLINLSGCLLLGFLSGLPLNRNAGLLLCDGFCGAFTTFSTFTLEGVQLIRGHARKKAAVYVALSIGCGAALFAAGFVGAASLDG